MCRSEKQGLNAGCVVTLWLCSLSPSPHYANVQIFIWCCIVTLMVIVIAGEHAN